MNIDNTIQPKDFKTFVENEIKFLTQQQHMTSGAIQAYQVMLAELSRPIDIDNIAQANKDAAKSVIDEPRVRTVGEKPNNARTRSVPSPKKST